MIVAISMELVPTKAIDWGVWGRADGVVLEAYWTKPGDIPFG